MAIKENEQPTFIGGTVTETAVNTLTVTEMQVPRVLNSRLLFDIDEIVLPMSSPSPTLGADAIAAVEAQVVVSESTPTALLSLNDSRILAYHRKVARANATDTLTVFKDKGSEFWQTLTHANLVPDDKVFLIIQGTNNKAGATQNAQARIKGKLAKVSIEDFEALVLSRLGQ